LAAGERVQWQLLARSDLRLVRLAAPVNHPYDVEGHSQGRGKKIRVFGFPFSTGGLTIFHLCLSAGRNLDCRQPRSVGLGGSKLASCA
jgi:hypothetical protein